MKQGKVTPTVDNTLEMLVDIYEETKNINKNGALKKKINKLHGKVGIRHLIWPEVLIDKGILTVKNIISTPGRAAYCWNSKYPDKEMASAVLREAKKKSHLYIGGHFMSGSNRRSLYLSLPDNFTKNKALSIVDKKGYSRSVLYELLKNETFIEQISPKKYRKKVNTWTGEVNAPKVEGSKTTKSYVEKIRDEVNKKNMNKPNTEKPKQQPAKAPDKFTDEATFVIFKATPIGDTYPNVYRVVEQYPKLQMFGQTKKDGVFIGVQPVKHADKVNEHFKALQNDFKKLDINIELINSFESKVSRELNLYDAVSVNRKNNSAYIYLFWGLIKLKVRSK